MYRTAVLLFFLVAAVQSQGIGTNLAEVHPLLTASKCVKGGTCTTQATSTVLDANWRWLHTSSFQNCYTGNTWNTVACPDPTIYAANCQLDGAAYASTYGITTSGSSLTIDFVTGANAGLRVYLPASENQYEEFKLPNQEFTFDVDVDVSNLPCGLNGALYFSQMPVDGGMAAYPSNKAGAAYGTGYCDAQCPQDIKFINGKANIVGWTPASNNANTGLGESGACCFEMEIWEANSQAAAYTPHVCAQQGLYECTGAACGNNSSSGRYGAPCSKDGCDFNSYRMGNTTFFGTGMTVDTSKPFTIVTQFLTSDGTATGTLTEIRRLYVQNGVISRNSNVDLPNIAPGNSITDQFCNQQKTEFGDNNNFETLGGFAAMDKALQSGMVLVMSLWDDYSVDLLWLDSTYPTTKSPSVPGVGRGPCPTTSGSPPDVESRHGNAEVIFSSVKVGDLGSTYGNGSEPVSGSGGGGSTTVVQPPPPSSTKTTMTTSPASPIPSGCPPPPVSSTPPPPTSSTPSGGGGTVPKWGQCGGQGYTGSTVCASGSTCQVPNPWCSQCL